MALLGTALGRGIAGGAAAAASLSSKYIDEELATQRAQTLAELQRTTASAIRSDEDAFRNDPTRVARDRENQRAAALAAGATAREVELAGLNDPNLRGARRAAEDEKAADASRRNVDAAKAMTPVEVERASLTAEARARQEAKFRAPAADSSAALQRKLADIDKLDFLSPEEKTAAKKALVGIGKKGEGGATEEVVTEMGPDGKPLSVKRTVKGPLGTSAPGEKDDPAAKLRAGIEAARQAGDIGTAIAELRKRGASPAQILQAGVTEAELQAASQPTAPRASRSAAAPVDPIQSMGTRDLRRIAETQGHTKQAEAKAELDRRRAQAEEVDTSGFGFQ